jgi:5-hydroxyisourate hydrolase-like protein (transthyretin family)
MESVMILLKEGWNMSRQGAVLAGFILMLLLCFVQEAGARTDLFFLAPTAAHTGDEAGIPIIIKGERLQTGSFDVLVDTRYIEPVLEASNRVKLSKGPLATATPTFFYMASVLDAVYDQDRPYLKTVRMAFAFQQPVNTHAAEELGRIFFKWKAKPSTGVVQLPVISNNKSAADLELYRTGGGLAVFSDSPVNISITAPERNKRYDTSPVQLSATASASSSVTWLDPFSIVEPSTADPVLATGLNVSLPFSDGIHAVFAVALNGAKDGAADWTVFGVNEDVLVSILGAIRVQVLESLTSLPVAGAAVTYGQAGHILGTCFTGDDGVCVFDGVDAGTYDLTASKETYDPAQDQVTVPKDQTVDVTLRILALVAPSTDVYEYGNLKLCVKEGSGSGTAVADAQVVDLRGTYGCRTDITGCCSVARVRKGIKFYWVAYTGSLFSEINQFSLTLDKTTLNLVVNPLMTTGLRMEARDALTLAPASGMEASALSSDTVAASGVTDGVGKAVLSPLSAGRAYTLRVATPGQPGPDGGTWQAWQDIDISYNQIVQGKVLPVFLSFLGKYAGISSLNGSVPSDSSSTAGLSISVFDTSAKALSGAMVRLYKAESVIGDFVSNSSGKVEISGLYPGQYSVAVTKAGYEGVTFDLTLAAGQQSARYVQLPQVLNPQVTEELLPVNGGNTSQTCPGLAIDVLNPYTGQPVAGVMVEIYTLTNGAVVQSGLTDVSGRYQGMGLTASTAYGIRLSATVPASAATGNLTWQEVREFLPISIPSDNVAGYSLYFASNSTAVVRQDGAGDNPSLVSAALVLKDRAGMPIANTKFKVESLGDGVVLDLVTDGTGKAVFSHDLPGKYRIKALPAGYQGMVLDIILGLGQRPTYNLKLPVVPTVLRPSYVSCSSGGGGVDIKSGVKVQVLNGFTGLPVSNVTVRILNTQNQAIFQGVTDVNGLWAQDSMSPQTVSAEISWQVAGGWRETQVKAGLSLKAGYREVVTFYAAPNSTLVSSTAPGGGVDASAGILLAVVDLQKRPLANVQVDLMNATGRILQSAYTDTQGRVSFERLATGSYALHIHAANRLEMAMNDLMIWAGNHFAWQVMLPDLFKPSLGVLEQSSGSSQLKAVVVNGQTFEPLTGVAIGVKDAKGQVVAGRSFTADTGFFTLEDMDSLGPVYLDIKAGNYLPQTQGPLQPGQTQVGAATTAAAVKYALYAMTPGAAFTAIANPDGIQPGVVKCMPGGQCIVQSQDLLTVFSYDPIRLEVRRQAQARLASATAKLLGFGLAPLGAVQRQVMSQTPYLALVQTGQGTLTIYQCQAVSGASVGLVTTLTVAGEITDAVLLYNGLAVSSTAGVFFYRLAGSDGKIAPAMVSYVTTPVRALMKIGPGLYGVSDSGKVVGIDISALELPVVTGIGELGYIPRNASAISPAGIIADTNSMLHPIRFSGMRTLGQASGPSLTSPDTLSSGMSLRIDKQTGRLSTLAIGKKAFGFGLAGDRLFTVEITDNVPIQTSSMQLPGEIFDLLPIRQRVNNRWSAGLMLATANGFYVLPLPEQGQETVNLSVDFARLLPNTQQNYRLWTAQGFTDVLNAGTDSNGNSQLVLNTALPSGVYDLAVVGEDGIARFVYYGTSLFTDASGSLNRMQPVLVLTKANRDRAAVFNPGDDIWLNLNLDVLEQALCDVHILLDYRLTGDTSTYHFYTTASNGMLGFNSWGGSVNSTPPQPLIASWPGFNIKNLYLPLISLPKPGGYGGAGMVSVVFTRPGGHPLVTGDVIGASVAGFSIRN